MWSVFFFNDTATTEIYTLSLHDALPIYPFTGRCVDLIDLAFVHWGLPRDRKSTRLNSSHHDISYAVFCLKKTTRREPGSLAAKPPVGHSVRTHSHYPE